MNQNELNDEINRITKRDNYSEEDFNFVKNEDNENYVKSISSKGPLHKVQDTLKTFYGILKHPEEYSKVSISIIIGALIYVISPIDLVPDAIPVLGLLDDFAVISAVTTTLAKDIKKYKDNENKKNIK